eukprot:CAMPEP_0201553846 /NCGR_PEP_ID=MMETSP0173_2-20130828/34475_1 /ASSEMBLY_ACC=CAM_ASM_000268 /TAXON_ID=218659 /ORGANISM="Vexillifera sp., Strain DIVA3 564/2" /LENGTH=218 /DNA_ID=CAMNT_0047964861 /DNA_START=74 /DNA_END=727 /DNA_ORIENTATION=+
MGQEIHSVLDFLEKKKGSARVLVVRGAGNRHFCTGMDLSSTNQAELSSALSSGSGAHNSYRLFSRLKHFYLPTIVYVNGAAFGGGFGLVFCFDVRIVHTSQAYFCFSEVKRGIVPALISSFIVPEIGAFHATQWMLTGARMRPNQAKQIGFVSELVDDEEAAKQAIERYIKEFMSSAPNASKVVKKTTQAVANARSDQQRFEIVKNVFTQTIQSEEAA